jgi:hypothetical protein
MDADGWTGARHRDDARDLRHRKIKALGPLPGMRRNVRAREVPLAVVMVALTTLTLWSLGQAIVIEQSGSAERGLASLAAPPGAGRVL